MPDIDVTDSPAERDATELEALSDLLASDGWQRYLAHVDREWGPVAYAQKIDATIAACKASGNSVEGDLCELGAACRQVRLSTQWPAQRIGQLKAKKRPTGLFASRRRA